MMNRCHTCLTIVLLGANPRCVCYGWLQYSVFLFICYFSYEVRQHSEGTVGAKKPVMFSFCSVPFERRPLLHVHRSVSVLLARASAIICWACFADVSKINGQLVR